MRARLDMRSCRDRQGALRERMSASGLQAALTFDWRHIHYLTGYWRVGRVLTPAALFLGPDGSTMLWTNAPATEPVAVDTVTVYGADRIGTIVDDPGAALWDVLRPALPSQRPIGLDGDVRACVLADTLTISSMLRELRRTKWSDEVEMLRAGIAGADAGYAWARDSLDGARTEVQLYAGIYAAATERLAEPITELGNDFRSGEPGGLPRDRAPQQGELAILDLGVVYRGYSSDLCRTFAVGAEPSAAQAAAHGRVLEVLAHIEQSARPGVSCRRLYTEAHDMLDGFRGWSFPHHLGHGIGLHAHEAPRLNPNWNDTLRVGDVFTLEPGLYGEELRAGVRIEQDYLLTDEGLARLSHFPVDL